MTRSRLGTPLVACMTCLMLGTGCSQPESRRVSPQKDANSAAAGQTTVASGASADSTNQELRLFGRDPGLSDVAFEGRASSGLLQHTTPSDGADFDPDVDPSGKMLVFASTRNSHNSHLYVKSVNGATITQITDGAANDAQPVFDPSGGRIAFASDRGGQWDIWIIDANGRNPIQITNTPAPEMHPSWSPDGKQLVYCRVDPKENRNSLWIVSLENPGVKRLIGEGLFPAWSPKGDKIAYQRARARSSRYFSIWTLDIQGDEVLFPTEVAADGDGALISPVWSPDGMQLSFTMMDPHAEGNASAGARSRGPVGRCDIGIVDVDGRGLQRLTEGPGQYFAPAWSTDGRIYFSARDASSETIWSVKPFRPAMSPEETPSATTASDRRSALAPEDAMEE